MALVVNSDNIILGTFSCYSSSRMDSTTKRLLRPLRRRNRSALVRLQKRLGWVTQLQELSCSLDPMHRHLWIRMYMPTCGSLVEPIMQTRDVTLA